MVSNFSSNAINMFGCFKNCYNLKTAVSGPNVVNMAYAYSYSGVNNAACGPNVTCMSGAYEYCYNLRNAVAGSNVNKMDYAYFNCSSLLVAACGDNVTNM